MSNYATFLKTKDRTAPTTGVEPEAISDVLYDFQRAAVAWAIRRGRAAIFSDCGTGKTLMQVEWARQSGRKVLIVAPLSVAEQTIAEAMKIGVSVEKVAEPSGRPGIEITNYEKLQRFVGAPYDAIVLDESGILKSLDGKTRTMLIREFSRIPRKLCCTATPAPNDISELTNHAEFLGEATRPEMLATWFVHDSDIAGAGGWRLKGHAREAFWKWVAKWALYFRRPSDLGFNDEGFDLPAMNMSEITVRASWKAPGMLFGDVRGGIAGRRAARKGTIADRAARLIEIIRGSGDQWLVWCGLNAEANHITDELGDAECVNIEGADSDESKIAKEARWRSGSTRVLVTKPSIFGWGMNWQHCHNVAFLGIGDSYEQYYQSIRRCWRFGQKKPVNVVIVSSDAEQAVLANLRRKEEEAVEMASRIVDASRDIMREEIGTARPAVVDTNESRESTGRGWKMMLGDCVQRIREIKDASVGLSVFSPPFASLYTYSASPNDMGNSRDYDQFFEHFAFLLPELLRVTMPGRRSAVHVQQVSTTKAVHGVIGWRDFRADVVKAMISAGWVYDGEVVIDKDPQAQAIRTKAKALMFVQKDKDSSWLRPAMADYILLFRHPGENVEAIKCDVTNDEWISWARPIWYGIRESETLNAAEARSERDERHICPLQLETIERCVRLWSNRGDTVLSPFAGIGSEGYVSIQHDRQFIGIELKREYFEAATRNLESARRKGSLFDAIEAKAK